MLENKCFCEKCNKIQPIKVINLVEIKDFNIGRISYNKLNGICSICGEEVYSLELSKKNKIEISKKIKELEEEMAILKIIERSKAEILKSKEDDDFFNDLKNILIKKKLK